MRVVRAGILQLTICLRLDQVWVLGLLILAAAPTLADPALAVDRELIPDTSVPIPQLHFDSTGALELGGVPERFKSTANRRRVAARTDVPVTGSLPRTSTSSRRARTARERLANGTVPTSREGLWAYCRQRLFARYGWRDGSGKRFLWTDFSVQGTDACVRAGGIVR